MTDKNEGGFQWGYFEKQLCICVPKGMTPESEEEQISSRVAPMTVEASRDLLRLCLEPSDVFTLLQYNLYVYE